MKAATVLFVLGACIALSPVSAAEQYPTKPIHLVVPFPAGGPTDVVARAVAQTMSKSLVQPIVIENKPGADGAIAAQFVANSASDGYTLLFGTSSVLALPYVAQPAPFGVNDLIPLATVGSLAFGLFVNPSIPSQSVAEFVGFARANPGKLNFGSANIAEQTATAQFIKATGVDMVRISYKGSAQAMPDLIAGRIQVYFSPVGAGLVHAKEGRVRMLATLLPRRLPLAPEVPTMSEAGLSGVGVQSYQMFVAPAKTPREIVERLARDVSSALKDPDVRAQLENRAVFIEEMTPQALATMVQQTGRDWADAVRQAGGTAK